jgi:Glycosyl hydrolase family 57
MWSDKRISLAATTVWWWVLVFCVIAAVLAGNVAAGPSNRRSRTASPLYLLTYDHGGVVLWGPEHFLEHLRNAAEWLDRYPDFKIGLDNEAYTYDYLAEHSPKVLQTIRDYLKRYRGRFGIGTCTYGQPLSTFINGESNIRQIGYAIETDRRRLGWTPEVYLMSEHAMHSQIPQILKGFGFTGAIMRTHFMMYGYNPTFDAAVGWWVGLDGSRIAAIPTYVGEGAAFGRTTKDDWILTRYPGPQCRTPLETFRKEFAHIKPLLASRADDSGLRREGLVKQYEGNPQYRWVLLEDIFPTFPRPEAEFKTAPDDFHVRMPWGYCGNEIWDTSRRAEVDVLTAERLAAVEYLLGGTDRQDQIKEAWKNLLVGQHHDIQICGLLANARKFLGASLAASDGVKDASLRYMAAHMGGGKMAQVTVFNPRSWPGRDWVDVAVSLPKGAASALAVRHGKQAVPSALLSADRYSDGSIQQARLAISADVPPLGLASYSLVPAQEKSSKNSTGIEIDAENLSVTTPYAVIRFDKNGGIDLFLDRKSGKNIFQPGRRSGFFAGTIEGRHCESKGQWAIEPGHGGAPWAIARESGMIGGIPYTLEMILRADSPRLDCRVRFQFHGQRIGRLSENRRDAKSPFEHEQKLRFKMFPAVGDNAIGVRDLPFAVATTPDRCVNGLYWTAIAGDGRGLAVFNRGTMGSVREADGGFSIPLAYAMYYIWGTRMLNGDFSYEFAIYPFSGDWQKADLHRRALEYNFPCVSVCTAPGDGRLGTEVVLLKAGSSDVIVSALYHEGAGSYVRMFEYRGREGRASVDYLAGKARFTEVDLAGREGQAVSGSLTFRPWQIRTIRIDPVK